MNKRILYALIFTSIFILSTVSLVAQPAAGAHWKFGIPKEARGMSTESEVKVYDKEAWGEHLGYDFDDKCSEKRGGDASSVGARSKTKLNDFWADDIDFFGEEVMKTDVPKDEFGQPLTLFDTPLTDYWSAVELLEGILEEQTKIGVSPVYLDYGFFALMSQGLQDIYADGFPPVPDSYPYDLGFPTNWNESSPYNVQVWAQLFQWRASVGILNREESMEMFGAKEYKGTYVDIDFWEFAKDGDYDSTPDEDDWERPVLNDPHDYYQIWNQFNQYIEFQLNMVDQIITDIEETKEKIQACRNRTMDSKYGAGSAEGDAQENYWTDVNTTLTVLLPNLLPPIGSSRYDEALAAYQDCLAIKYNDGDLVSLALDALVNATGKNPLQRLAFMPAGLKYARPYIMDIVPLQKKELLALLFQEGIYAMQPVDKYLEKLVDDFNIDEDRVWGDDFEVNQIRAEDMLHKGGITVEGRIVTVEYDWAYDIYDTIYGPIQVRDDATYNLLVEYEIIPADAKPRKDYKIIYTYGDTGGQISVEYVGSDTFYKIEGIAPLIPGYEIPILLAAAAISAIGLIYVVMKKKRM